MALQKVVLVGAGGNLGPQVLQGLLDGGFDVTILARKSSKSTFPSGVKVATVSDDYPLAELVEAFKGQDAVISTVAGESTGIQKTMIDAAVEAGVQRFIPAEFGSKPPSEDAAANPLYGTKLEIKEYLRSKESTGLTWNGIANGAFFEWGITSGFLHFDLNNKKVQLFDKGEYKFLTSTWRAIQGAVNGALKNPEQTKNRMVYVRSFEISQVELLAELEKATGSTWEREYIDGTRFVQENKGLLNKGEYKALYGLVWAHVVSGSDHFPELDNNLFNIPKEDLTEMVSRVVKSQS